MNFNQRQTRRVRHSLNPTPSNFTSFDNQFHKRLFSTAPPASQEPSQQIQPPKLQSTGKLVEETAKVAAENPLLQQAMKNRAQRPHDMVKMFGRETWEQVVLRTTERLNQYLEKNQKGDKKASGIDNSRAIWGGQRFSPAVIHDKFRNISTLPAKERASMILNIWLSAVDFKVGFRPRGPFVNMWITSLILLVMTMISAGGVTRLTRSGLSMTHWKLTGEKKPQTDPEWNTEFELYKQSPEWRLHNQDMLIDDFKFIYNMEYGHRQLGRAIGVAFAVPFAIFLLTGAISIRTPFGKALAGVLSLGGIQGLIGWWMVKSGLDEEANKEKAKVSPYRLATHLTIAFTLLIGLTSIKLRAKYGSVYAFLGDKVLPKNNLFGFYRPTKLAHALTTISFLTAITGAFVAGNDAGLVYNEWPAMGEGYVPSDIKSEQLPWHRNIFENPSCVQFIHRTMAYTTFGLSWATALRCFTTAACPGAIVNAAVGTAVLTTMQAGLGIYTLLNHVPTEWAAGHQFGAMLVLMSATRLLYHTNNPINSIPNLFGGMATLSTLLDEKLQLDLDKKALKELTPPAPFTPQGGNSLTQVPSQTSTLITKVSTASTSAANTTQAAVKQATILKSSAGLIAAVGGLSLFQDTFNFNFNFKKQFKD